MKGILFAIIFFMGSVVNNEGYYRTLYLWDYSINNYKKTNVYDYVTVNVTQDSIFFYEQGDSLCEDNQAYSIQPVSYDSLAFKTADSTHWFMFYNSMLIHKFNYCDTLSLFKNIEVYDHTYN
jgi:hypothetical protein